MDHQRHLAESILALEKAMGADAAAAQKEVLAIVTDAIGRLKASVDTLLAIQREVIEIAEAFVASAPEELRIDLMRDTAADIGDQLSILIDNAVFGLGLVLVLLFVFLSPSAAVWVSAGIPVAMAAGLGLMWLTGQSLNMISMFALLICVPSR